MVALLGRLSAAGAAGVPGRAAGVQGVTGRAAGVAGVPGRAAGVQGVTGRLAISAPSFPSPASLASMGLLANHPELLAVVEALLMPISGQTKDKSKTAPPLVVDVGVRGRLRPKPLVGVRDPWLPLGVLGLECGRVIGGSSFRL